MEKVLFTHSYFLRFDPKQWKLGQPYAPLGTLYAAALLRENGFEVALHDTMFAHKADDVVPALQMHRPKFLVIYDDGFNYLTKMCLTNMREAAFEMIQLGKEHHCTVIVSSSDATDHFEEYLRVGADFVLTGEAEHTLLELVQTLSSGGEGLEKIAGLVYRESGGVVKTQKRSVIKELDSLPLPAWDIIDMEPYRVMWMKNAGYFSLNIATTRGCPYKCNWCAKPIYGNRYNVRSPENVVAEIKLLQEQISFEHIWFCDDIFGLKPGWVQEFSRQLSKEDINIRFKIQSRADLLLQEDYVSSLAAAGCEKVWMGAESGSQKILDAMDKGITVGQIREAVYLLKKHRVKPCFFIQFGYLDETEEDIEATIQLIEELLPHEIGISVSYPLPGTKFYEKVKEQLKLKANWTDSDELALMFHNNHSSSFYKQLHRYVHKRYRTRMALQQALRLLKYPLEVNVSIIKKVASAVYYLPATLISKARLKQLQKAR